MFRCILLSSNVVQYLLTPYIPVPPKKINGKNETFKGTNFLLIVKRYESENIIRPNNNPCFSKHVFMRRIKAHQ